MTFNKKFFAMFAAGTLTAAAAVPAMALENEFHGMMAVRGFNSNYLAGTAGRIAIEGDSATTKTWVEQRARLFYTAKANDNLKLVTGFELDSYWGKNSYDTPVGRNSGGALGSDSVSIETKWTYLDFTEPTTGVNFKVGMQGLNDAYKGLFVGLGADAAGVLASKGFGPVTTTVGWFRLDDRNTAFGTPTATTAVAGKITRDLLLLDGNYAVNKDTKFGASYYFVNNDNVASAPVSATNAAISAPSQSFNDYTLHVLGVRGATVAGPATIDAFALYEFGNGASTTAGRGHINAFAGNVAAKIKAGPGSVKVSALYVSGNSGAGTTAAGAYTSPGGNAFYSINNTTSSVFAENGVAALGNTLLLARNPKETTNEQAIIPDSGNLNQGIIGGSVGYDYAIDKLFGNVNVAIATTAKDQGRGGNWIGEEYNAEVGYKMFDNMSASVRGAYLRLGNYYSGIGRNGSAPANPYATQIVLNYTF